MQQCLSKRTEKPKATTLKLRGKIFLAMVTLQLVLTPLSASAQKSESAHLILGLAATGLAPL
ncbi:MAG: hypothetical protein N2Z22_10820, partial [Turneriella sp.]|nr:hypothetical protein [Turneriella sp.]